LFSIFETISIKRSKKNEVPLEGERVVIPLRFEIVSLWKRSNHSRVAGSEKQQAIINLKGPGNKKMENLGAFSLDSDKKTFRTRARFNGIYFWSPGIYSFEICSQVGNSKSIPVGETQLQVLFGP